ncbi:MAG TPA: hypothetical protein VGP47_04560 [Parachlamydiaceae bacterium]|nr:hypothetical protein [Parachlamydiaceae bacterium]
MRKRVESQLKLKAVNTATDLGIIPVAVFTACSFFSIFHTLTHVAICCRRIRGLQNNNLFVKLTPLGYWPTPPSGGDFFPVRM